MDSTRTFIAIAVPDLTAAKLVRLQSLLAPDIPGMRWAAASPFHITLAFLGDVAHAQLNEVCRGVAQAVELGAQHPQVEQGAAQDPIDDLVVDLDARTQRELGRPAARPNVRRAP